MTIVQNIKPKFGSNKKAVMLLSELYRAIHEFIKP